MKYKTTVSLLEVEVDRREHTQMKTYENVRYECEGSCCNNSG